MPMRRAAVDSARIVNYTIKDEDVGVGFRVADKVVSNRRPADYVTDGVDDEVEINAAINALTSGRTWYESVLLKGSFTLSERIRVPDYTYLKIIGSLKLKDGAGDNIPLIQNSDPTAGNSHVTIEGPAVLDGNRANNPTGNIGIYLGRCEKVSVRNLTITSTSHNPIRCEGGSDIHVSGLKCYDIATHGPYFYLLSKLMFTDTYIDYAGLDGFACSSVGGSVVSNIVIGEAGRNGFSFDGATRIVFANITIFKMTNSIFGYVGPSILTFSNIIVKESSRTGLNLAVLSARTISDITISNCKFYNINTALATDIPVILLNCEHADGAIRDVKVNNCYFDAPNATYALEERLVAGSIDKTQCIGNKIINIGTAPFSFVGAASYGVRNDGYNPVGYISPDPTWGTSPWTYTNSDHVPEDVYMQVTAAGDVTSITKNGQDLPLPGTTPTYICSLQPGESIVITYTAAGTLKRFGW